MSDMHSTSSQWTVSTLHEYSEAIRKVENKFLNERDRRYTEVGIEREKALRIKETADLAALELARNDQTYKQQQSDILRDKNLATTGIYATHADVALVAERMGKSISEVAERMEAALTPVVNFMSLSTGRS